MVPRHALSYRKPLPPPAKLSLQRRITKGVFGVCKNIRKLFTTIIQQNSQPSGTIALCFLATFLTFVILLGTASTWPSKTMRIAMMIFGGVCSVGLPALVCIDLFRSRSRNSNPTFKPSLAYTVLLVWASIPLLAFHFCFAWYPLLRTDILVPSTDSVTRVTFPSIAVFQRNDWTSQGNLLGNGSKCYLGWYNETAPACSSLSRESLGNTTTCNCTELWYNNDKVIEDFEWNGVSYRYMVFDSEPWLLSNNPTYMMTLQTMFNYNAIKAHSEAGTTNPTLYVAVYDPLLGMQRAFETGFTRMNLVNANGIVSINVDLRRRERHNGISAYDYGLGLSASPNRDLVCDTSISASYQGPCHLSLFVQIPTFDRTIISTQKAMTWAVSDNKNGKMSVAVLICEKDVAAMAGAYFSFAQIIAWIVSGQVCI